MNALFKKILILLSSAVLLVFLILVSVLWAHNTDTSIKKTNKTAELNKIKIFLNKAFILV